MFKLLEYIIGFRYMKTRGGEKNAALSYMQKNNVIFSDLTEKDGEAYFKTVGRLDKNLLKYADTVSEKGLLRDLKRSLYRPGLYFGALFFITALILSDSVIWEVRYAPKGDENVERIGALAAENGLKSGVFKSSVNKENIENLIMLKCPDVSYVNVDIKGTVATVVTDERVLFYHKKDDGKTDLFASEDGYIIRCETFAGKTVCEKGQTVRKGDLLITGTYDTFHHGTVTVKARGAVYALVKRSFLCECPDTEYEKAYTGKEFVKRSYKIFSYGEENGAEYEKDKYDKTTDEKSVSVFSFVTLPIKVRTDTYREYTLIRRKISEREANDRLDKTYEKQLAGITADGQIKEQNVKRYYERGSYKLYCEVWLITNIAK